MAYNVQFTRCSQEKFDALETKDNNTIYFITDTPALYLGSVKYTSVTELAAALTRISASETSVTNITNALKGISLSTDGSVKSAIDDVSTSLNTKIGSLTNLKTASKTGIVSSINEVYTAVGASGTASVVSLLKETKANAGYLSTYTLYQGSKSVGQIDIPKDLVVSSGSVVKATADDPINGLTSGEFIKLVIQNQDDPIYINASSLVDVYTAKSGADKIQLSVVGGVISADVVAKSIGTTDLADSSITTVKLADENITDAKIARGTITKTALATAIQTSLTKADSAVQSVTAGTANGTVKVDGTDLSVTGLKSAAYTESSSYDIAGAANAVKSTVMGAYTDTATSLTLYGLKAKDTSLESSITSLTNTINSLDVTDAEESGSYVSAVSQTNGKITVARKSLPDYSTVYDAKGSADTALSSAKSYVDTALTWHEL